MVQDAVAADQVEGVVVERASRGRRRRRSASSRSPRPRAPPPARVRDLGVGDVEAGDVGGAALDAGAARRRRGRSRSRGCACRPGRRSSRARRSWRSRRCCGRSGCARSRRRGRGRSRSCVRARRHRTSAAHHTCPPMARVTVCIPTYKRVQWLGATIASALGQTFTDLVVEVHDDATPDGSVEEVVAGFDDPRLRYVRWDDERGDRRQLHALAAGRVERVRDPARRRRHRGAVAGGAHGGRVGRASRARASRTRASR